MKIKAGELMNMRTRAERARLALLSAKPCPDNKNKALNVLHVDEDLQDDTANALQEYEDLLTQLINNAEVVI